MLQSITAHRRPLSFYQQLMITIYPFEAVARMNLPLFLDLGTDVGRNAAEKDGEDVDDVNDSRDSPECFIRAWVARLEIMEKVSAIIF